MHDCYFGIFLPGSGNGQEKNITLEGQGKVRKFYIELGKIVILKKRQGLII